MSQRTSQFKNYWLGFLLAVCVATFYLYGLGFDSPWTFDDEQNLGGLAEVHDFRSALAFALGNEVVGNFGRPLAMASFLANLKDWPDHPEGFRRLNVLLHICNGLLVAWAAAKCACLIPRLVRRATPFAVTLASVWLLHPFLVSASLMAVQRMTVLAATFTLLGFLAYLYGRACLSEKPVPAYLWMSGGMLFGSLLGVLAKENAALLPLLTAVLEWTVLSVYAPVKQRLWAAWRALVFGGTALCLVFYFAWSWGGIVGGYAARQFTLEQRMLSESVILFSYLKQIVWPDIALMGPFQDDTSRILSAGHFVAIGASVAWLLLIFVAILLRSRCAAVSFGVLFFVTGHLMESTVVPLELYYEHRNYLPSLGPLAALMGAAWAANSRWLHWAALTSVVPMAWLLWQTAALWGRPDAAAAQWAQAHPTSVRAAQNLAIRYARQNNYQAAAATLEAVFRNNPDDSTLAIQHLSMQCFVSDRTTYSHLIGSVSDEAHRLRFTKDVLPSLDKLVSLREAGRCSVATPEEQLRLVEALMASPSFNQQPVTRWTLLILRSRLQFRAGNVAEGLQGMRQAFDLNPTNKLAGYVTQWLIQSGNREEARHFAGYAASRLKTSGRKH